MAPEAQQLDSLYDTIAKQKQELDALRSAKSETEQLSKQFASTVIVDAQTPERETPSTVNGEMDSDCPFAGIERELARDTLANIEKYLPDLILESPGPGRKFDPKAYFWDSSLNIPSPFNSSPQDLYQKVIKLQDHFRKQGIRFEDWGLITRLVYFPLGDDLETPLETWPDCLVYILRSFPFRDHAYKMQKELPADMSTGNLSLSDDVYLWLKKMHRMHVQLDISTYGKIIEDTCARYEWGLQGPLADCRTESDYMGYVLKYLPRNKYVPRKKPQPTTQPTTQKTTQPTTQKTTQPTTQSTTQTTSQANYGY